MKKYTTLTIAGIGFLAGSRAGTGPYDAVKQQFDKVMGNPTVQQNLDQASAAAKDAAGQAAEAAKAKAGEAASAAKAKASDLKSDSSAPTTQPADAPPAQSEPHFDPTAGPKGELP